MPKKKVALPADNAASLPPRLLGLIRDYVRPEILAEESTESVAVKVVGKGVKNGVSDLNYMTGLWNLGVDEHRMLLTDGGCDHLSELLNSERLLIQFIASRNDEIANRNNGVRRSAVDFLCGKLSLLFDISEGSILNGGGLRTRCLFHLTADKETAESLAMLKRKPEEDAPWGGPKYTIRLDY